MTSRFDTFSVCTVLFVFMCVIFFLLCYSLRANELFMHWPAFIGCLSIKSNSNSNGLLGQLLSSCEAYMI